jgi:hypothetical protein
MSIENTAVLSEAEEASIRSEATKIIAAAAVKGGYSADQIPTEARQDALNFARRNFIEQKALKSNPLWETLEAERAAHQQTRKELEAFAQVRPQPVSNTRDNGPDPNVVRARMGEGNWRALTDAGRLKACGVDPASVTEGEIIQARRIFGRGADTHAAVDLSKADFGRYKHLKRIAVVMGLPGQ